MAATFEYVAFLDDDDYWLPGKLEAQMPRFGDDCAPVLVCSAMMYDDGTRTYERLVPKEVLAHVDLIRDRMAGIPSGTSSSLGAATSSVVWGWSTRTFRAVTARTTTCCCGRPTSHR